MRVLLFLIMMACLAYSLAACGGSSSSDESQAFFSCAPGDTTGIRVTNLSAVAGGGNNTLAITSITVVDGQLFGDDDVYSIPVMIVPGATQTFCMPVGSLYQLITRYEDGTTGCVAFVSFPGTRICDPADDGRSLPFELVAGEIEELESAYRPEDV